MVLSPTTNYYSAELGKTNLFFGFGFLYVETFTRLDVYVYAAIPLTSSCMCGNAAAKFMYMRQCRWEFFHILTSYFWELCSYCSENYATDTTAL